MIVLLMLGDVRGECKREGFLDWIEVESMSEGMTYVVQADDSVEKSGRGMQWMDTNLTKLIDRSSVRLRQACATGILFETAEMVICTDSEKPVVIFRYCFRNVTITSVNLGATRSTDLFESISFAFESVEWIYTYVDPVTGEAAGSVTGKAMRQP